MALVELLACIDRRLRELGISERKACLVSGVKADCIRTIRRGHPPTLGKLKRLAAVLDMPLASLVEAATDIRLDRGPELAYAEGTASSADPETSRVSVEWQRSDAWPPPGYVVIPRAGAEACNEQYEAMMPESLVRIELGGDPQDFQLVRIEGSTMSPILEHGDQVIVDRRRQIPAEPGLFLIDEGMGPVARWVQFIPGSEPPRYRVSGENPRIEPYELPASEANLVGRIVWYARRV